MIIIIQKAKIERDGRHGPVTGGEPVGEPIIIQAKYEEQVVNMAMVQIRQFITHKQSFTIEVI